MRAVRGWATHRRNVYAGLILCAAAATNAQAQRADSLRAGTNVRVFFTHGDPLQLNGKYVRASDSALTIVSDPGRVQQTRRFADIASMEMMVGSRSPQSRWWRGATTGAIAGFAITTAAFFIALNQDDQQSCSCVRTHAVKVYLLAPPFIAGAGALGGWIATNKQREWTPVVLPAR